MQLVMNTLKQFIHSALILIFYARLNIFKSLIFIKYSKAQLRQDIFALSQLNYKKNGYFVEFGATDGIYFSNSYLLEKKYDWTGILSEPAKTWHEHLKNNRSAIIETNCVWKNSRETIEFFETEDPALSTVGIFNDKDNHATSRVKTKPYYVQTISLEEMLDKYSAPKEIDFLSIDTEGSELSILENFDFSKYQFRVICCEHNYTENRDKIYNLLKKNGYVRKNTFLSRFDDWYVKL
jgi:FkbM family methyltransferase